MTSKRANAVTVVVALFVVGSCGSVVLAATSATGADTVGSATEGDAVAVQEENETTTATETTAAGGETTTDFVNLDDADITFDNQTSNGTVVNVTQAVLPEGGFVTVHLAQNVTGNFTTIVDSEKIGQRVGNSTYLEPGLNENVTIRLDRPVTESQTLIAVLHRDTNGNQQFDPALERTETVETTPAQTADATTTPAAEQVDAAYTQDPGDEPIAGTAFVRVEDGGAVGTTTAANETTTETA
ncbi:hypothetical protein [Halorussus sp. MSC15.2]|uniref:DUF7282 domain-containing protein n=1 Tax=Halorussus sp. MSC15.2 TaxID=2283638 RepID=UPI0013D147C5|nr:hypothetical protein [Halorussus sp. MSC15.2]NEU55938.1 hypothetical protein [Halorussus sp. MSC15.2]